MEVSDLTEREMRIFMQDMMELNQCVECKSTLTSPVITCLEGHFSCEQCRKSKCSVCGSNIANVQLSTVSKWIMLTPRECEFASRGCKAILLPSSPHEIHCPYSYICELCGASGHIVKHFEERHKQAIHPELTVKGVWNDKDINGLKYFLINGTLFRVSIHIGKTYLTAEVYCMRSKRSDADYIYTMEYKYNNVVFTYTGFVLNYKTKDKLGDNDESYMNVPVSFLPLLYTDGQLHYTIRFSQLKLELATRPVLFS